MPEIDQNDDVVSRQRLKLTKGDTCGWRPGERRRVDILLRQTFSTCLSCAEVDDLLLSARLSFFESNPGNDLFSQSGVRYSDHLQYINTSTER